MPEYFLIIHVNTSYVVRLSASVLTTHNCEYPAAETAGCNHYQEAAGRVKGSRINNLHIDASQI